MFFVRSLPDVRLSLNTPSSDLRHTKSTNGADVMPRGLGEVSADRIQWGALPQVEATVAVTTLPTFPRRDLSGSRVAQPLAAWAGFSTPRIDGNCGLSAIGRPPRAASASSSRIRRCDHDSAAATLIDAGFVNENVPDFTAPVSTKIAMSINQETAARARQYIYHHSCVLLRTAEHGLPMLSGEYCPNRRGRPSDNERRLRDGGGPRCNGRPEHPRGGAT